MTTTTTNRLTLNTTTRILYWLALPAIAYLAAEVLGVYVGVGMALLIAAAGVVAGITKSAATKRVLILFSVAYFGAGAADVLGLVEIARQKEAELAPCKKAFDDMLAKANEHNGKFYVYRSGKAGERLAACRAPIDAKYAGKGIDDINPDVAWLAIGRVAVKAAKELATALLVEALAIAWGSVLFLMLGLVKAEEEAVAEAPVAVEAPAKRKVSKATRKKISEGLRRHHAAKRAAKAAEEAEAVEADHDNVIALPTAMVKSQV